MEAATKKIIETIAAETLSLAQAIMDSSEMGLRDSALKKNMQVVISSYDNPVVIETLLDDYARYIEQGRKPMSGKQPPTDALRDWALAHGIATDNSTLFVISRAIWRHGYEGRPILATLEEKTEERWHSEWADMLFDAIVERLTTNFLD